MKEKVHKIKEDNVAVNNSNHIDKQKIEIISLIDTISDYQTLKNVLVYLSIYLGKD